MSLKLLADGLVGYFSDKLNAFDALVVALSLAEMMLDLLGAGVINLSPLRTLRLARAFKLARSFKKGLRRSINTMVACLSQARNLSLLLVRLV